MMCNSYIQQASRVFYRQSVVIGFYVGLFAMLDPSKIYFVDY